MDISSINTNYLEQNQAYKIQQYQQRQLDEKQNTAPKSADSVHFSDEARLLASAQKAAQESPDVRQELVDSLRNAIKNGTYSADTQAIARGLLRDK